MLLLTNEDLAVSVLEPGADEAKLGSRYCSAGYVWQVTDVRLGPVFAGPRYPDPAPPPFDGQGMPEVFELALGQDRARVGEEVYVLGVGRVRRESAERPFHVRDNPTVVERATWQVENRGRSYRATTNGHYEGFAFELARELQLAGRTLISSTVVRNRGMRELPIRWFAHPFFPAGGPECCRLSLESALPEGAPLFENARGFLERRAGVDWGPGHYVVPRVALGGRLSVEQLHPQLGVVTIECRFPLGWLALWGNDRTFSVEPFFQTLLPPQGEARWSLAYSFGVGTESTNQ